MVSVQNARITSHMHARTLWLPEIATRTSLTIVYPTRNAKVSLSHNSAEDVASEAAVLHVICSCHHSLKNCTFCEDYN